MLRQVRGSHDNVRPHYRCKRFLLDDRSISVEQQREYAEEPLGEWRHFATSNEPAALEVQTELSERHRSIQRSLEWRRRGATVVDWQLAQRCGHVRSIDNVPQPCLDDFGASTKN